ncbi:MAG TPA: selenium cofactor biosynthesis protein YqeC [Vicinamibacteria bacterium]|nr:selenium cofactor biosynthesis protein YqeC [Vicinamibacteria bacterium]
MILSALGIVRGDVVAVAGAGGKTTLVYRLAAEARACGLSVLVTTTTHMGAVDEELTGPLLVESEGEPEAALVEALTREGRVTLLGRRVRPDKLEGVAPSRVDALARLADLVLVEADGARGRSLKVPAAHEPVIPATTTVVVVVCALDVLGHPLDDERVHRVELVRAATGVEPGEAVDEDCVAMALRHADGYPARIPARARAGVFLNKAEDDRALAAGARLAARLIPPYRWVVAGSARSGAVRSWPPMRRIER